MGDETMETNTRLLFQETLRKGKREEKIVVTRGLNKVMGKEPEGKEELKRYQSKGKL